jgi:mannosyl-3-phosphoglycerate phosphatase
MEANITENCLHQTSYILYIAIDTLIPPGGNAIFGLDEFAAALDHRGIPAVWLTNRSRLQLDEPRRKLAHTHPFIAEDGCGVFLPEDYFHLKPQASPARPGGAPTVRLGRFTCLPVAKLQPGASEALEALSEETSISVVPLRSLPPRELAQNLNLPPREADLARQRDFDELFFFAGASPEDMKIFEAAGKRQNVQLRQRGVLWSLAIGASVRQCVRELSKLYDRAILLTDTDHKKAATAPSEARHQRHAVMELPLRSSDVWERLLESLTPRR